jgi:hypothetical protein
MHVIVLCEYLVRAFSTGSVLVSVVRFTITADHNVWLFVSSTGVVQSIDYCCFSLFSLLLFFIMFVLILYSNMNTCV